jgi:hypothetical protein
MTTGSAGFVVSSRPRGPGGGGAAGFTVAATVPVEVAVDGLRVLLVGFPVASLGLDRGGGCFGTLRSEERLRWGSAGDVCNTVRSVID